MCFKKLREIRILKNKYWVFSFHLSSFSPTKDNQVRVSLCFPLLYRVFLPNWVTNTLIYNKKVMVSPAQPYIVLWVESLSKNRNLFDIEAPGSKETVAFQAEAFGRCALYFLYKCPTNVQNARSVLSWTLSKQDFICSWCCCSNTFLETSNKKRCSTGKRCWIYSSAKITLFLPPPPTPRDNCQLFPDCLTGQDILS